MSATLNLKSAEIGIGHNDRSAAIAAAAADDRSADGRHPRSLPRSRLLRLRSRLGRDRRSAARRSPMSTATTACCSIAAIRSTTSSSDAVISKSAGCCSTASCRPRHSSSKFTHDITHHTMVNEQLHAIYRGFRRDSHPMAVMCGVVGALAAFYHDGLDIFDPQHRMIASHRLIAKMPTIAAMAYKYSLGQPSSIRATISAMPRTSSTCCSPCRASPTGRRRPRRERSTPC